METLTGETLVQNLRRYMNPVLLLGSSMFLCTEQLQTQSSTTSKHACILVSEKAWRSFWTVFTYRGKFYIYSIWNINVGMETQATCKIVLVIQDSSSQTAVGLPFVQYYS